MEVGSYLTWEGWPRHRVFQDPRINGYPPAFHALLRRDDLSRAEWDALLAGFGVTTALVTYPAENPRAAFFDPDRWALVYRADDGLVFVRRRPEFAALVARAELPVTFAFDRATGLRAHGPGCAPRRIAGHRMRMAAAARRLLRRDAATTGARWPPTRPRAPPGLPRRRRLADDADGARRRGAAPPRIPRPPPRPTPASICRAPTRTAGSRCWPSDAPARRWTRPAPSPAARRPTTPTRERGRTPARATACRPSRP